MDFVPTDPDVETIVRRVQRGIYDLQPDFQRGDVWTVGKQQRLIDSIVRRWHIPPIHLVDRGSGRFDVLDGQQRLTAIRNFVRGDFPIDGAIEPRDPGLESLHGKRWGELPEAVQDTINSFSIRIFSLTNYQPNEPYELFFRLNQPTNLTEAEKRNAFVGAARNQIKDLTVEALSLGMAPDLVGFSNNRMAYDEVLARFAITIETSSLSQKLTSARITQRYRDTKQFDQTILDRATQALKTVLISLQGRSDDEIFKLNKATLHTWLCVAARAQAVSVNDDSVGEALRGMEKSRTERLHRPLLDPLLISVYSDRATSRVLDVSSVILRDFCSWLAVNSIQESSLTPAISAAMAYWQKSGGNDVLLAEWLLENRWGDLDGT